MRHLTSKCTNVEWRDMKRETIKSFKKAYLLNFITSLNSWLVFCRFFVVFIRWWADKLLLYCSSCLLLGSKNVWTDRELLVADSSGPREPCIRWGCRQLTNAMDRCLRRQRCCLSLPFLQQLVIIPEWREQEIHWNLRCKNKLFLPFYSPRFNFLTFKKLNVL